MTPARLRLIFVVVLLLFVASCGAASRSDQHAVGTNDSPGSTTATTVRGAPANAVPLEVLEAGLSSSGGIGGTAVGVRFRNPNSDLLATGVRVYLRYYDSAGGELHPPDIPNASVSCSDCVIAYWDFEQNTLYPTGDAAVSAIGPSEAVRVDARVEALGWRRGDTEVLRLGEPHLVDGGVEVAVRNDSETPVMSKIVFLFMDSSGRVIGGADSFSDPRIDAHSAGVGEAKFELTIADRPSHVQAYGSYSTDLSKDPRSI